MKNRIGVVSCHLSFDSLREAFEKACAFGFGVIEWFESDTPDFSEPDTAAQIVALSDEYGIVSEYHAPYRGPWDLGRLQPDEISARLHQALMRARRLGAERVTLHMGTHAPDTSRDTAIEKVAHAFAQAAGGDIRLCVENSTTCHNQTELGVTTRELERCFEIIGKKPLGWTLDVGHANVTDNLFELLERFGNRLLSTHLHDTDGISDGHLPPGKGTVDWSRLFSVFVRMGYEGPLNFEFPETSDAFPEFARSIQDHLRVRLNKT